MRSRRSNKLWDKRVLAKEPVLLSSAETLGLILFLTLLCIALWFAFRPDVRHLGSTSSAAYDRSPPKSSTQDLSRADGQLSNPLASRAVSTSGISFGRCGKIRRNCVVDGDTFWLKGVKIRLADVDTPEIGRPRCSREYQLGILATTRLIEFLNEGDFDLQRPVGRKQDRYGRELYVLKRGNRSFGLDLVGEGLAHRWFGYKQEWCD
jgi:endonuclease YncB( thermonuclease family)